MYKAWEQDDLLFMQIELCMGSVEDYVEKIQKVPEEFVWSFLLDMLLVSFMTIKKVFISLIFNSF
jgi:membrane-associated tyrosine- and threonine-specific cdc2-inhibitory kinase